MASQITSAVVEEAWQAYAATKHIVEERPELAQNEYFKAVQDAAFARFMLVFEAMEITE